MSSAELTKAAIVRAPHDIGGTANDFGERIFTCDTTHAANAVPDHFKGQYVRLVTDVECFFAFSDNSSAEVDRTVAASAAGASDKAGRRLLADTEMHVKVPDIAGTVYFVRESAATAVVRMSLASG